jgi:transposase InsO family protein
MAMKGFPSSPRDNAVVESFFASLKRELIDRCFWMSRDDARAAVFEYIEVWYRQRRHSTLGYLSPKEFERPKEHAA